MAQWNELKQIESMDTATGLPHPLRRRFDAPGKVDCSIGVEVMVDSKPASFGIVVDAGGWILTKASVLNGKLSCRMPDQSVVDAEKRAESQEHDLALLKLGAGGLTVARFYDSEPPSIAQACVALARIKYSSRASCRWKLGSSTRARWKGLARRTPRMEC